MQPLPRKGQYVPDHHMARAALQRDRKAVSQHDENSLNTAKEVLLCASLSRSEGMDACQHRRLRPLNIYVWFLKESDHAPHKESVSNSTFSSVMRSESRKFVGNIGPHIIIALKVEKLR